jgi:hypothetical protein
MSSDDAKIKSADQVIRSGIAGGVAGCVVCNLLFARPATGPTDITAVLPSLGKDGRCAARPCQDPLSGLES